MRKVVLLSISSNENIKLDIIDSITLDHFLENQKVDKSKVLLSNTIEILSVST